MAIIDNVVKNLKKGEDFNCGGDSVDFNIPKVGKVTVKDSDWGKDGFDVMTVESNGRVHQFESKKFPNQFKKIGDYIGKECAPGREVEMAGLGRKREHKVHPIGTETPRSHGKAELPEAKRYNDIKAMVRNTIRSECEGTVDCQAVVASIESGPEPLLRRLLSDINLKLNNSHAGLSKGEKKAYAELAENVSEFLNRIDSWRYSTDRTREEPFLSWVAREYPEYSK